MAEQTALKPNFTPVAEDQKNAEKIYRPLTTFLQDAWYRFRKNKLGLIGLSIIIFMVLLAVFGPYLSPYTYDYQDLTKVNLPPSAEHWMGTDSFGRDLMIRVIYGARISLSVGAVSAAVSLLIGVTYGIISGYCGGIVDTIMMRILEIIDSVPQTLYVILLMVVFDRSLTNIFLVIGLTGWLGMARMVRGEVLSLKSREYVLAAKVSNVSTPKIMSRHLVSNAIAPILVSVTLAVPGAIFMEAYLQFLGLGSVAIPSWGGLSSDGLSYIRTVPHLILFPSIFICITILAFNFLGDALRDALDPKM